MRKITLLLVSLLFAGAQMLQAQRTITGTVISAEEPQGHPSVTVQVQGTNTGTVTDAMGRYSINVPSGATALVFSAVGMATQEIQIGASSTIDVTMASTAQDLEGVIITAYGTSRKEAFTGAATQVSGATLAERTQSNIGKALAGAASGVQIAAGSGQPGSDATIRIRGVGSVNASSNPLIVIDGVPAANTFSLSSINMADVEALTVLKDAAANAMYGARGANGVILITTKKGRAGKTRVSLDARVGINQRGVPGYRTVKDPGQYMELLWEGIYNTGMAAQMGAGRGEFASREMLANSTLPFSIYTGVMDPLPSPFSFTSDYLIDPRTGKLDPSAKLLYHDNWFDATLQNGLRQEYTATINGGTDKTAAFFSLGYLDDNSYTINSNFQRYSARLKVDQQVNDWLKTGMNLSYSKRIRNTIPAQSYNMFDFAQNIAPIYPVYLRDFETGELIDGKNQFDPGLEEFIDPVTGEKTTIYARRYGAGFNPVYSQKADIWKQNEDETSGTVYADVNFLEHFVFTANLSAGAYGRSYVGFQNPVVGNGRGQGYGTAYADKSFNINTQQLLNWNQSFDLHHFEGILGHEFQKNTYNILNVGRRGYLGTDNPFINMATGDITLNDHYEVALAYQSILSRLQYNYNYKYYASASFRRDGSSRFHPDHRWGNFWSLSGAWRIEQEDFLKNASFGRHIDLLKFKASFGTQGNDAVLYPIADASRAGSRIWKAYENLYEVTSAGGDAAISKIYHGVKNLTWETSHNFNIGFDFALFKRLNGTIEWYNKKTVDMLFARPLPPTTQPDWRYENALSMRNYGWELELTYDIMKTRDLQWSITGNITTQNNKLLEIPEGMNTMGYLSLGHGWFRVGHSIYDMIAQEFAGIDPMTGLAMYWVDYDKNGNVIRQPNVEVAYSVRESSGTTTQRFLNKSGLSNAYGGLRTNITYKEWDFLIATAYQIGGWGMDGGYSGLVNGYSGPGRNIHMDQVNNRWQNPGDLTNYPILVTGAGTVHGPSQLNGLAGTAFLTSKSAFTLQTISVGYTFPKTLLNRAGIESLRVYATVDNTWLWSARKGFDPRSSISGGGAATLYPEMRTYSLGLNINF
ncbi:MAG: SusC/RagA family TonB-linked outer membrane protein [Bacteroidales bacterium]|jgi:TonB-linked SusC/RagA family outer membrane protein|nr:SusC/RagA family TonB-linked outer membrane protein [Bacteroidales bacterium]